MMRFLLLLGLLLLHSQAYRVVKRQYAPDSQAEVVEGNNEPQRMLAAASLLDDHRVRGLPGLNSADEPIHYAGHILVDQVNNGHFFYWLFESPQDASNKPLIIWLNGGPGCSSMDGLFLELGPFRLSDDGRSVRLNPYSWHKAGNLLFVDQPVGTGLSFTSKDGSAKNDEAVNAHFTVFLSNFFEKYPAYVTATAGERRTTRPIVFSGESHAGHYIPSLVAHLLKLNKDSNGLVFNVDGMALGNPWIDPMLQYNPADFAHGLGLLSAGQSNHLKVQEGVCQQFLSKGVLYHSSCLDLLDHVVDGGTLHGASKVLMYDVRQFVHSSRSFPPGHDKVEDYLNRADVRAAIHASATPHRYVECADPPYTALVKQDGKGVTKELAEALQAGVRTLVYSGQFDLICNHLSTETVLNALPWSGKAEWNKAPSGVWLLDKRPVGYQRSFKNLQSLLVLDAGHMVPMDVPVVALQMITSFVQRQPLQSGLSKVGVAESSAPLCRRDLVADPPSNFAPIIAHLHPLADSAQLRLRLQHLTHSSELIIEPSALRIEPGAVLLPIDPALFNSSHAHADIHLTDLAPGKEYTITIEAINSALAASHPAMRRPHKITAGCYRAGFAQCCHHGVCKQDSSSAQAACHCDQGYTGDLCNRYLLAQHGTSADNHTLSSGNSVQCAARHTGPGAEAMTATLSIRQSFDPSARNNQLISTAGICSAEKDCCVELELSLPSLDGLPGRQQEALTALLEHDLQLALQAVPLNILRAVLSLSSRTALLTICADHQSVAAAIHELERQFAQSESMLRSGMVSSKVNPQYLRLVRHGPSSSMLSTSSSVWWWLLIAAVMLLAASLAGTWCCASHRRQRRAGLDRLPTSTSH